MPGIYDECQRDNCIVVVGRKDAQESILMNYKLLLPNLPLFLVVETCIPFPSAFLVFAGSLTH
jgi:hypothetical protein